MTRESLITSPEVGPPSRQIPHGRARIRILAEDAPPREFHPPPNTTKNDARCSPVGTNPFRRNSPVLKSMQIARGNEVRSQAMQPRTPSAIFPDPILQPDRRTATSGIAGHRAASPHRANSSAVSNSPPAIAPIRLATPAPGSSILVWDSRNLPMKMRLHAMFKPRVVPAKLLRSAAIYCTVVLAACCVLRAQAPPAPADSPANCQTRRIPRRFLRRHRHALAHRSNAFRPRHRRIRGQRAFAQSRMRAAPESAPEQRP